MPKSQRTFQLVRPPCYVMQCRAGQAIADPRAQLAWPIASRQVVAATTTRPIRFHVRVSPPTRRGTGAFPPATLNLVQTLAQTKADEAGGSFPLATLCERRSGWILEIDEYVFQVLSPGASESSHGYSC